MGELSDKIKGLRSEIDYLEAILSQKKKELEALCDSVEVSESSLSYEVTNTSSPEI
ncbi:MAG: hypothetical protein JEY99_21715 [Spirochaetales bacterium]|nr:hypothetical protein [Spirochaetales bacterium]